MEIKKKNKFISFLLIFLLFISSFTCVFSSSSDLTILTPPDDVLQAFYELDEYKSGDYYYTFRCNNDYFSVLFVSKEDYPNLKQYISSSSTNHGRSYSIYFNTDNSELYRYSLRL